MSQDTWTQFLQNLMYATPKWIQSASLSLKQNVCIGESQEDSHAGCGKLSPISNLNKPKENTQPAETVFSKSGETFDFGIHTDLHKTRAKRPPSIQIMVYPEYVYSFSRFCRDHMSLQYKTLVDCTAIDYPSREARFVVVYNLCAHSYNSRISIKTAVDEFTPLESITELFSSASWWEREVWDMFGILFSNHPDLRRILSDYGFTGHPLRKDFPLSGYVEVRYDDSEKRVISEKVQLSQEFRAFDFSSPWEQLSISK